MPLIGVRLSTDAVCANEDGGHLQAVYYGKFPVDDPYRAVRVAEEDVKKMPPADGSSNTSTVTSNHSSVTQTVTPGSSPAAVLKTLRHAPSHETRSSSIAVVSTL
jgi:hypothetical protein